SNRKRLASANAAVGPFQVESLFSSEHPDLFTLRQSWRHPLFSAIQPDSSSRVQRDQDRRCEFAVCVGYVSSVALVGESVGPVWSKTAVDHRSTPRSVRISVAGLFAWSPLPLLDANFSRDCGGCDWDGHLCSSTNDGSAGGGSGHTVRGRLGSEQRR